MIKNQLKHILVDENMSIRHLAERINVTYSIVYDFANMRRNSVQFRLINEICKELEISPGDLLAFEPDDQL